MHVGTGTGAERSNGSGPPLAAPVREDGGELLSVLPAGTSAVALGPVASLDHALRIAGFLDHLERASPWWWADLMGQCELRWGETYAQLEAHCALETKTLRNRKWVGGRFPAHRRRPMLSFGHHDVAAGLPDREQDGLLDWAEAPLRDGAERPRSVTETRDELWRRRGRPGGRTPGENVPPAGRGAAGTGGTPARGVRPAPGQGPSTPGGGDMGAPWPDVERDATARLAAWLAEGARLLDALADGAAFVVEAIPPRDVDASGEVVALLARAVRRAA